MRWGSVRSGGLGVGVLALALALVGCGSAPNMGASTGGTGSGDSTALPAPEATAAPGVTSLDPKPEEKKEASALRVDLEFAGADKDAVRAADGKKPGDHKTVGSGGKPDKVIQDDHKPGGSDLAADEPNLQPTPAAATGERLSGNVDPTSVRTTLTGARDVFRRCSDSDIKLELDLTITPSGDVMEASASSSAPDDVRVRDCVVSALRKLRFQPFGGSEAARISLGLALRR